MRPSNYKQSYLKGYKKPSLSFFILFLTFFQKYNQVVTNNTSKKAKKN